MKKQRKYRTKEDIFIKITAVQFTVALLIFAVLFGIFKINSELFYDIKQQFSDILEDDFDLNDFVPFNDTFFLLENDGEQDEVTQIEETVTENAAETVTETVTETEDNTFQASGGEDLSVDEGLEIMNFEKYALSEKAVLPVVGTVTSEFGYRIHPVYGTNGLHSGKDIAASEGTKIYAALSGTVIETGVGEKSGNYVKIDHSDGIVTLYAHCSEVFVEEGINVRKGEVIAAVGSTGLATGPHLHFEVIIDGEKCDPDYLLADAVRVE